MICFRIVDVRPLEDLGIASRSGRAFDLPYWEKFRSRPLPVVCQVRHLRIAMHFRHQERDFGVCETSKQVEIEIEER